jgi:hypothetical protein
MMFNTLEGFKYALCENGVIVKQSKPFSDQKKALKSAKDMCYYYNKKANANSDLHPEGKYLLDFHFNSYIM